MNGLDPQTPEQWQEAVDLANFYLMLDAARQYGLVTGGPEINADRCKVIMLQGGLRGIRPTPGSVERLAESHFVIKKGSEGQ